MKKKNIYTFIAVLAVAFGLMFYGSHKPAVVSYWKDTTVKCLPNGHTNVNAHSHTVLEIMVNGEKEDVPADVGISTACMAEVHTHEADSKIHVETVETGGQFTLGDFYRVWGQQINRSGLGLKVFVDGEQVWGPTVDDMKVKQPDDIILKDDQTIRLEYTNKG
jgi:hypothetical protein